MANFGIARHAHVEAAFSSILLTLSVYGIKWLVRLHVPDRILGLPFFMVVFGGFYVILYVIFLKLWSGK